MDVGTKLVKKALTPKSKNIIHKYTSPNTLVDSGDAVRINELVKKLNTGMGIKKT